MNILERSVEIIVSDEEQSSPSILDLPVSNQASEMTSSVKNLVQTWLSQEGQYQRPDVDMSDRLEIARRFWSSERPWGEVTRLSEEYKLSRQSIYNISYCIRSLFKPHIPGPVAGLKALLSEFEIQEIQDADWSQVEAKQIQGRLILTGLFPGGVPLRPLEDMLNEVPGVGCSDSTISRRIELDGAQACAILKGIDFSDVSKKGLMIVIDETFFDEYPVLFVVDPHSLTICDFYVSADKSRTAETWSIFLMLLKEDQGLNIIGGMGDAATAYPKVFETLVEKDEQFREDHFHILRDVQRLCKTLENRAYRAFESEYKAAGQFAKKGTDDAHQKLLKAQEKSERLADEYDNFSEYASWVPDALQIVDLASGEIRDEETNKWLLQEAGKEMAQIDHKEVRKMSKRLKKHNDRLLAYLDDLDPELPKLQTSLQKYLQEPDLAKVVSRAVARHWRLKTRGQK